MAKKETSSKVSKLAARHLGAGPIFTDPDYQNPLRQLGLKLGVSERAIDDIMLPELHRILDPFMDEVRSLAASVLSQDETPDEG